MVNSRRSTRSPHGRRPDATASQLFTSHGVAGSVTAIDIDLDDSKITVTVTITDGSKTVTGVGAAEAVQVE